MDEGMVVAMEQALPTLLIFLDLCAACGYAVAGDWRRVVYWLAAAVLTASVTF